ncbi:hypothetical protein V8E55_007954 [Tylopilus felleus]
MATLVSPDSATPPQITWIIISCHITAITCTVGRILYRWYTNRFWWEDLWAIVAGMWTAMCLIGFIVHDPSMSPVAPRNEISEWFATLSFIIVVWAARFSIFLSLVRVSNPTGSSRYIALACVTSFVIMCVASTTQKIYYCIAFDCSVSSHVAIMQLITDVLADSVLVLTPVLFLRDVQLSKNRRILILSAFSSSILISAVSIAHSVFLFRASGLITLILSEFKVALSLFICNILVLVTFIYRIWRRGRGEDADLDASFPCSQTFYLTSIDPTQFTTGTFSSSGGDTGTHYTCTNTNTNTHTHTGSTSRHCTVQEQDASSTTTADCSSYVCAVDIDSSNAIDVERPGAEAKQDGAQAASVVVCDPPGT